MRTRKIPPFTKPNYAIVGDGKCEKWYFQMLQRNERNIQVTLKPELARNKPLNALYEQVKTLSEDYSKVFWIIDLDQIIKESNETAKGKKTRLKELEEYCTELKNKYENVIVIVNNPCFEYWLLLHFEPISTYYDRCTSVEQKLKKKESFNGYKKTEKYYIRQNPDIYLKLKPYLKAAIKNAKRLGAFYFEQPYSGISGMHLFFETEGIKHIGVKR